MQPITMFLTNRTITVNCSATASKHNNLVASRGFTLVELMVTIAVMAIIVSIAAPSFSNQMARQRQKDAASSIEAVLKQAKSEARILNKNITVTYASNNIKASESSGDIITQSINSSVTISASNTTITITPSATTTATTFEICDSKVNGEDKIKVRINVSGNISTSVQGICS